MNSSTKQHNRPREMSVPTIRKRSCKRLSFVCSLAVVSAVGCTSYLFSSSLIGGLGEGVVFANETPEQQVSELTQLHLLNSRFGAKVGPLQDPGGCGREQSEQYVRPIRAPQSNQSSA